MLPLTQKPSLRLLTWKADTGGWWDTCGQRGALDWPGETGVRLPGEKPPPPPYHVPPALPALTPAAQGGRH